MSDLVEFSRIISLEETQETIKALEKFIDRLKVSDPTSFEKTLLFCAGSAAFAGKMEFLKKVVEMLPESRKKEPVSDSPVKYARKLVCRAFKGHLEYLSLIGQSPGRLTKPIQERAIPPP